MTAHVLRRYLRIRTGGSPAGHAYQPSTLQQPNPRTIKLANIYRSQSNTMINRNAATLSRSSLGDAEKIVVKLGSAVITREDECGIALGRLASIIEQVSELHLKGHQMVMVTSGAVAYGKQKLTQEVLMSMSMRQNLFIRTGQSSGNSLAYPEPRACAAAGQSGLMALYEAMFSQYGVRVAQVLVTKPDFYHEESRNNLTNTITNLMELKIVPIINTNDAVSGHPEMNMDLDGVISLKDNDSLSARLSVEIGADLMILMTDVNGLYTKPPGQEGSRLITTYSPSNQQSLVYGGTSRVGLGGMESKVKAATWAMENGVCGVICNGLTDKAIVDIVGGRKIGTLFTMKENGSVSAEQQASMAKEGSLLLQNLEPTVRQEIIHRMADLLLDNKSQILEHNSEDVKKAKQSGVQSALISRLALTETKLGSLVAGLRQIAEDTPNILGRVTRQLRLADGMHLRRVTVPIGVLLVIFESRPDCLAQIAALAISSGNGLLLKGGSEASSTNQYLHWLVQTALEPHVPKETIGLVHTREDIQDLLELTDHIDLVIPRGSKELVKQITAASKGIPVLGHSEGVCHVYVDKETDRDMALQIIQDSKCDYPSACNAMETLLLHESLLSSTFFDDLLDMLKREQVKIYAGPVLSSKLKFPPPSAASLRTEYGDKACTVEVVRGLSQAVAHINKFGSSHTDTIVTTNDEAAKAFLAGVDSACVFHNASTRFADGYRFGLGAEVGISTGRIHSRGPMGVEGLLTSKWILKGSGNTVQQFDKGEMNFTHDCIPQAA